MNVSKIAGWFDGREFRVMTVSGGRARLASLSTVKMSESVDTILTPPFDAEK